MHPQRLRSAGRELRHTRCEGATQEIPFRDPDGRRKIPQTLVRAWGLLTSSLPPLLPGVAVHAMQVLETHCEAAHGMHALFSFKLLHLTARLPEFPSTDLEQVMLKSNDKLRHLPQRSAFLTQSGGPCKLRRRCLEPLLAEPIGADIERHWPCALPFVNVFSPGRFKKQRLRSSRTSLTCLPAR